MHVHGLGYDVPGNVLYIATHTGMFKLADGASKATRIAVDDETLFAALDDRTIKPSGDGGPTWKVRATP